jgi:hypothetical protein
VRGLANKLNDSDFIDFISEYDILVFTETWNCNTTNIDIKGYDHFNCPRPKTNKSARRYSGGIVVYYRKSLECKISLVKINRNGIL